MKLVSQGLIAQGIPSSDRANCCFPSLAYGRDGKLWATWRTGSQKDSADGKAWIACSTDGGQTWGTPTELFSAQAWPHDVGEPHYAPLTVLRNGSLLTAAMWVDRSNSTLPLFNPETEGCLSVKTLFQASSDGTHWGEPWKLPEVHLDCPLTMAGPVMEAEDGTLLCPLEVNKNYHDRAPWRHAAILKKSTDGGRTWPEFVEVANDPTGRVIFWDVRLHLRDNGRGVAAFWTYDRVAQHDLNIHLARTEDGGRTWSYPQDIGLRGQVADPVLLNDGRVLLAYVDRFHTKSIRLATSQDGSQHFTDQLAIYEHMASASDQGIGHATQDYLQDMSLWTFGRVHAVTNPAETMAWIVYYAGDAEHTDIRIAQIEL